MYAGIQCHRIINRAMTGTFARAVGRSDGFSVFVILVFLDLVAVDRSGEGSDRSLANADVLANAYFNALVS